jgi:hypothetical protein
MLLSLPWAWLLGAGLEMPAAVVLQDGCAQLETFTRAAQPNNMSAAVSHR